MLASGGLSSHSYLFGHSSDPVHPYRVGTVIDSSRRPRESKQLRANQPPQRDAFFPLGFNRLYSFYYIFLVSLRPTTRHACWCIYVIGAKADPPHVFF